jgi:hypothetical protein
MATKAEIRYLIEFAENGNEVWVEDKTRYFLQLLKLKEKHPLLMITRGRYLILKKRRFVHAVHQIITQNRKGCERWAQAVKQIVQEELTRLFVLEYESGVRMHSGTILGAAAAKAEAAMCVRYPSISSF